jgi:signal transduction histidine kinase
MPIPAPSPEWLERANRLALVSRLLASTVHDVNNALQVIAGSVELLQMAPAASEMVQRRIAAIDTQAKRASTLLQELSEFVRDARESAEPVDLAALCRQVVAARHYSLTKLRITAAVEGDAVFVMANPRHVQQILLNLVVNSEEAHASTLTIRVAADGDYGTAVVDDNAPPGGPPQAANLGIGLEVSTWLAGKNGGSLTREPLPAGSRAIVKLPSRR